MTDSGMLDAAFAIAKKAHGVSHENAKAELQDQYPNKSFDEIMDVYLRACSLADACYDAGDRLIGHWEREQEILASLKERFPGFSEQTYNDALNWGTFLAR
jgi:hypothetical protein